MREAPLTPLVALLSELSDSYSYSYSHPGSRRAWPNPSHLLPPIIYLITMVERESHQWGWTKGPCLPGWLSPNPSR
jgi:hypothetical protein